MRSRRKVFNQVLLLLRNLKGEEIKIKDIEFTFKNGSAHSCKIEICSTDKPDLKIVKGSKDHS